MSNDLTEKFGKGFTYANIKNMRQFYLTYSKLYATRSQLSWTHFRTLMRIDNELVPAENEDIISTEILEKIISSLITDEEKEKLKADKEIVLVKDSAGGFRFRVNIYLNTRIQSARQFARFLQTQNYVVDIQLLNYPTFKV